MHLVCFLHESCERLEKTQRNTQACLKQPKCFEDASNIAKSNGYNRLTPAFKLIWPSPQESGANTKPADCATVQLNANGNMTALYPFWQRPVVREATKRTHVNLHSSKSKATVPDGGRVTGGWENLPEPCTLYNIHKV